MPGHLPGSSTTGVQVAGVVPDSAARTGGIASEATSLTAVDGTDVSPLQPPCTPPWPRTGPATP